jgi:integration host factor subunit alpha
MMVTNRMTKKTAEACTLKRVDLQNTIYESVPILSHAEAKRLLKYFFEEITAALKKGEPVKLNSFGKFCVRTKRERIGRNPRTGTQALITRRKVLTFKASPTLVARINGETIDDEEQCLRPLSSLAPSRRRTAGLGH